MYRIQIENHVLLLTNGIYAYLPSTGLQWRHETNHLVIDYDTTVSFRAELQNQMTCNGSYDLEYRNAGHLIPNWMGRAQLLVW